jgi:hypothetical protein
VCRSRAPHSTVLKTMGCTQCIHSYRNNVCVQLKYEWPKNWHVHIIHSHSYRHNICVHYKHEWPKTWHVHNALTLLSKQRICAPANTIGRKHGMYILHSHSYVIATASVRHEARCLSIRFTETAELTISVQSTDPE